MLSNVNQSIVLMCGSTIFFSGGGLISVFQLGEGVLGIFLVIFYNINFKKFDI